MNVHSENLLALKEIILKLVRYLNTNSCVWAYVKPRWLREWMYVNVSVYEHVYACVNVFMYIIILIIIIIIITFFLFTSCFILSTLSFKANLSNERGWVYEAVKARWVNLIPCWQSM